MLLSSLQLLYVHFLDAIFDTTGTCAIVVIMIDNHDLRIQHMCKLGSMSGLRVPSFVLE